MKTEKKHIIELYKSKITVFTLKDLAILLKEDNFNNLKARIKYFVDQGYIIRKRKGIYVKENYNKYELAIRIYTPAYISFETVLQQAGIIFQPYESIFAASYLNRRIELSDGQSIELRKLKNQILINQAGIIRKDNYFIAGPERAFLDMIYVNPEYYFDNLDLIDFAKCRKIISAYGQKTMFKRLESYAQLAKTQS
ncbi:MAG: hypothetical protein U9Q85_04125 [Patescibacteria group bacterium]|nr:hypothetical protein [Patescibacteria group bacterium]